MKLYSLSEIYKKLNINKNNLPVRSVLLAIIINLIIEMFSRASVIDGLVFLFTRPVQFFYGVLVILFTVAFAGLFKRKVFVRTLIYGMWVLFGVVNFVVTQFRNTPFTAQDFRLLEFAYKVAPAYLKVWQIVLIIILAVAVIVGMIVWWKKAPKNEAKVNTLQAAVVIIFLWLIVWGTTRIGVTLGFWAEHFGNIVDAYDEFGFAYCFSNSLVNSGIDRPDNYSEQAIEELLAKIESLEEKASEYEADKEKVAASYNTDESVTDSGIGSEPQTDEVPVSSGVENAESEEYTATEEYPNIIFLQLESLFNPELLKDVTFSETVLPNLTALYEQYPSGLLAVPSVGAGTANTEFEVISGMNINDFGPGEYPYKTVLVDQVCESICFDLKEYGYTTNALHNNDGTFYDRNRVFAQLGFDTFTPIEYMSDMTVNPIGWSDDSVLVPEIRGILKSSKGRDYIYAISVQGHGDYPEDYEIKESDITAEGEIIEEYVKPFTYYINQLHEMDEFVGELIEAVAHLDEPIVLVMYGDHLPAFDIEDEDLLLGDTFTTQYVVWNNIGLEKENVDLEAFQLSSYILDTLNLEGGAISKYHSTIYGFVDEEEYLDGLKLLEYDILYGNQEVYDGRLPYSKTNIHMGYKNITINVVSSADNHVVVYGRNFTPYSCIYVNGEPMETLFSSSNILLIDEYSLEEGDNVTVIQKGADGIELSSTSIYVYKRPFSEREQ